MRTAFIAAMAVAMWVLPCRAAFVYQASADATDFISDGAQTPGPNQPAQASIPASSKCFAESSALIHGGLSLGASAQATGSSEAGKRDRSRKAGQVLMAST